MGSNSKFIVGGIVILFVVIFLIISSTQAAAQYFYTIDELFALGDEAYGRSIRLSGAVLGDTIEYDPEALELHFTVVHMPADNELINEEGGLAGALNAAVNDPTRQRLDVIYYGPPPDLLQHEAQAILSGTLNADGVFEVEENGLLLKCPTRYEEAIPAQVEE